MIKYNTKLYKTLRSLGFGFLFGKRAVLSNGTGDVKLVGTKGESKGLEKIVSVASLRRFGGKDYTRMMAKVKKINKDWRAGKLTEKKATSQVRSLGKQFISGLVKKGRLPKGVKVGGYRTSRYKK